MNLPNKLTLIRIFLIPLVVLSMVPMFNSTTWSAFCDSTAGHIVALVLFCVASITDFFDGQIARRYNLVTNMGKFLDPIADKMLVLSVFIVFIGLNVVHPIVVVIILARELAVTGLRTLAAERDVIIAAGMFGKLKTVVQMITLIWLMSEPLFVKLPVEAVRFSARTLGGNILIGATLLITLASGIDYFIKHRFLLKDSK